MAKDFLLLNKLKEVEYFFFDYNANDSILEY